MRATRLASVTLIVGASALVAAARDAHAGTPADVLQVDVGTPESELDVASADLSCQAFGPPKRALVCRGGLGGPTVSPPESTTYWILDGRVAKIYELSRLGNRSYAQCLRALRHRIAQVEAVLGRPPTKPAVEPPWLQSAAEDVKRLALEQGRIAFKAVWLFPGRELSVALHADKGVPVLVVGLEAVAPRCDRESIATMLMDLFPPAPATARVHAAKGLAACQVAGATGALNAAAASSQEPQVKAEMARARRQIEEGSASAPAEASAEARPQVAGTPSGIAPTIAPSAAPAATPAAPEPARVPEGAASASPAAVAEDDDAAADAEKPPATESEAAPKEADKAMSFEATPASEAAAATEVASTEPSEPSPSVEPEAAKGPSDGTALAITTSLLAGGVWGGGLSLLAQQSSPSVVLLVGTAGAVIGGGTAFGLTHFGVRPTTTQALWFANSTAWGTLAGLMAWAGTGSDNVKLKWGLLVGGETVGMGMGVLGAHYWQWTGPQIVLANTLVLGAGLTGAGGYTLAQPGKPFRISPLAGYGTAPAMVGAAMLSRYLAPTGNDLHLSAASAAALAWTGGALAYGLDMDAGTRKDRLLGGALLGMGVGYLGATALSPLVEISPRRTWAATAGMLAGNLIGLGSYMAAAPDETSRRPLAAGLGGLGLGVSTFLAYPHLRLGEQAAMLAMAGVAYGGGTWSLAMAASNEQAKARWQGGALALGTASGIAGLLASARFNPTTGDYGLTFASAGLGAMAGIGVGKLATETTGRGELAGTLAGSAAGLVAGAALSHYTTLRAPDLGAGLLGAGYGSLVGALAPTLASAEWNGWQRKSQGGLLLGLPAGAFAGAALAHLTEASGTTVGVAAAGSGLGLGMGLGTGLLVPDAHSQPARIGAVAGASAGLLAALLLEHPLRLDEGLGDAAAGLGGLGMGVGLVEGVLLAGLVQPSGDLSQARNTQVLGGVLLGGSSGLASGLILSKYFAPDSRELAVTAGGGALGGLFGRGLAMTLRPTSGRADTAGTMAGVLAGTSALALTERYAPLSDLDLVAGGAGMAYGGILGALAPTLADAEWGGRRRSTEGGLLLGLPAGALAAAGLRHATAARPATVAVATSGGLLGLGMGAGTGLLWPEDYSQPARIGTVAGMSAGLAAGLLLEHPLRWHEGLGESAPGLGGIGAGIGVAQGILLAGLVDPSGRVAQLSDRQLAGGTLLGGSAGLASGLVLAQYFTPTASDLAVTAGGTVLGGLAGRGLLMNMRASEGRGDAVATMAGGFLGTTAFALTQHYSPLGELDFAAAGLGAGVGGVVGALAPTLADAQWGGWRRSTQGGLLLGLSGGAMTAAGLAHATGSSGRTLAFSAAGAVEGALTGAGIGILADRDPQSTQGARIGVVAGAASGLALGLVPHPELDTDELLTISAVTALGGWMGAWSQVLGHASLGDVENRKVSGGLLAGGGGAMLLGTALLPALHVDQDLLGNAMLLDGMFTGAGAGVGALASRRADAPVWGMLGAGTAGLVLGGALHSSIDIERSAGLLTFGTLEGLWLGAWLPYVLRPSSEVRGTDRLAGLAAGGLGGAGLSLLASPLGTPSGQRLGMAAVGSAVGASLAGGSVLIAESFHDQRGAGLLLGGTAAGLGLGALVSPYVPLDTGLALHMATGAGLGAGEGLVFAWAGRATTRSEYAGSALVGAGVGATLGLASNLDALDMSLQQGLVATGFSAWGGWIGSFSGALVNRNPHEVVLGGLAAANVGFLAGYGAIRYDVVQSRDFGWLSLAGAIGAAAGGGVGAALSSSDNPRPVLAGLAIGPVVGIGAGAFIVPHLRRRAETSVAFFPPPQVAGARFELPSSSGKQRTSADVLAERKPSRLLAGLKRVRRHLFDVTNWTPVFGTLPPAPGDPNPAPLFVGVSGGLR